MDSFGITVIANPSPVSARSDEHLWRSISMGGDFPQIRATSGSRVTAKTAMGYPPLWRAISLISSSVAGLPFDVFRRQRDGGKRADLRHPAQALLDRAASPYINAYTFRRTMTSLALLHGNAYASIDRVEGRPVSLSIWNPANTMVRVMDGEIWYITYFKQEAVKVSSRDMLHIRGLGPDGIVGYPILELMADAMGVGMAAMEFGARFFGQGSNMSGLLMIPGHFTEEKIRNTMQAWNSMQSGLSQSHKVALIQDGVKFQQLQISPDQAQFLQTREHEIRATVSNITGVPPHMLGDSTRTSHNSLESEGQSYLDYTLQPWLKTWENECEDKLLTEQQRATDSHLIEFNREALIQMSFESKINGLYRQLESGIINHNEARALLNMPTLGEDGEARYRPANWMEIGGPAEEMAGGEEEDDTPDDSPDEEDDSEGDSDTMTALRQLISAGVAKACEIEAAKAVQIAGRRTGDFLAGMADFYATWAENTLPGLVVASVRTAIQQHASASYAALEAVVRHATPDTLKGQVEATVAAWATRKDDLLQTILKKVSK